jgi:hypothetical protein
MKKLLLLSAFAALFAAALPLQAQRYLTEIFPSKTIIHDIHYATNISIATGAPAPDSLFYDVYRPMNDTMQQRPVVIIAHTGSFLPVPFNGQATGSRRDSAVVTMCNKLASRGFVAVAMSYRFGWNPTSSSQETRTGSLLQAAYRGIQDARTLIRHLRNDAISGANQHKINPNKIVMGGMGTGGYISLGVGYLDSYDEINLGKFLDTQGNSFVDTATLGDIEGKWTRALNTGHYPNESSAAQFVFNMGGAIGDSSWLEAGEPPVASVHCPNDPFAPYALGNVIVPTTGDFVVEVSGSYGVQHRAQRLGVTGSYDGLVFIDPTSVQAATVNGGLNGLFPFFRPSPESAPWEEWDSAYWANVPHPSGGTFTSVGLLTNPDMSATKSNNYIDSTLNFIVPRIVCSIGLANCSLAVGSVEEIEATLVSVFPNPSATAVTVETDAVSNPLQSIIVTDLSGRQVKAVEGLKSFSYRMDHADLSPGMYFLTINTKKGVVTKKVMFN